LGGCEKFRLARKVTGCDIIDVPSAEKALRVVSGFNDRMQDHALAQPQRQWIFRIDLSEQNAAARPMEHLDFPRI
jgi:hypothetical protein